MPYFLHTCTSVGRGSKKHCVVVRKSRDLGLGVTFYLTSGGGGEISNV